MSYSYDQYLAEHIGNVGKGLQWMLDNLPLTHEQTSAIEQAMQHAHDQSKYDKEEYDAYDAYFYSGNRSFKVCQGFNYAWLHHIHNNPHHWQYWVLMEDDPETGGMVKPLRMPIPFIFEMIADWWSFSWKNNNLFEIFTWYGEHRIKQILHPETRAIVEDVLKKMWKVLVMTEVRNGKDRDELEKQYISYWIEEPVVEHSDNDFMETVGPDDAQMHGIIGQKWGVHNGPPYPLGYKEHRKIKLKELKKYGSITYGDSDVFDKMMADGMPASANPNSFIKEKGCAVYRVTRYANDNEHLRDRVYVSDDPSDYINEEGVAYLDNYISKYTIKKDLVVAGRDDIFKIYKEVTNEKLSDNSLNFMASKETTEIAKRFKEKAIEEGFDAMVDPFDTMINPACQAQGYPLSMTAMIVFNPDNLKYMGSVAEDEYYSNNLEHSDNDFMETAGPDDAKMTGIKGMRWGVRNGPPYPLDSAKVAEKLYSDAEKKSKKITKDVENAAKRAGGEIHGLENQLKTVDSIERKLNKKVNEKGMDITGAANSIKDAVRYTIIAPTDKFVNMYYDFKADMANKGYSETSCDNYFDKFSRGEVKHKAVQSNFADKDGYEFEVQFHTPESQYAKDKKLPLYNERRTTGISENRAKELEKQMEDLAMNIPDPEGVRYILSHGETEDDEDLYGIPKLKKFPMPDKKHVRSAIRFFNYVDPKHEKELAEAILEKAEEFGLDLNNDISVGDENRFKKYLPKKKEEQS